MTKRNGQPRQPKIIGAIGDCNPFTEEGGIILDHGDGHPTLVWFVPMEWDESTRDKYGDPTMCEVYTVALDKRQVLGDTTVDRYSPDGAIEGQGRDVYTLDHFTNPIPYSEIDREHAKPESFGYAYGGCPHSPAAYTEWWDESLPSIAQCSGQTVEELREAECSEDPIQRAWFYWTVASYHGWHELTGGDVDRESIASLRKRWSLRMWRARKEGIRVYA